jgi:ubiquinone biosynthesis protein COQ4
MPQTASYTWAFQIRPLEFVRVVRLIRDNPDDVVELGARMFLSVGGHDEGPTHRRFLRTDVGTHLVENTIGYPDLFTNYDRLHALPSGTLGREYVRELDERGIHPVELNKLVYPAYEGRDFSPDHAYVRDRVRDAHDIYHTLTGYGIDILGEAGVLAFTFGQTGNKGWAMLVLLNHLTALAVGRFNGWAVAWKGYLRGRRARYLPAVDDWERLLQLPIEQARAELGISPIEPYRPLELADTLTCFENYKI